MKRGVQEGRLAGTVSHSLSGMTPLTEQRHRHTLMTTGENTAPITISMGFTKQYNSVDDAQGHALFPLITEPL